MDYMERIVCICLKYIKKYIFITMDYNSVNGSVKMYAYGQSVSDADVSFFGSAVAKIYFYENNDTVPNRIKYISW